tara:strand:- start:2402 stop:2965 length:564 start_codon:yes stop_codon:yes gene_type:complete
MKEQPKIKSLKRSLIDDRKGKHIRNKNQKDRENREVLEVIGITEDQLTELQKHYGSSFTKNYNRLSGRIRTLNRMIDKREQEIQKYKDELEKRKLVFSPFIKMLNPTIQLKKPTKNFPYWKGRIWWNMGYNDRTMRFNTKGRRVDFHLCSEKERKEMKYTQDDLKEICLRKFRQRILSNDFGIITKK